METTHKVRIWTTERYKGKRKTTYRVRWVVKARKFGESFEKAAQADAFRARLVAATSNGEAFDIGTGLPLSMIRERNTMAWFDFACAYMDMKWPDSSPKYRKSLAGSLVTITAAMLKSAADEIDQKTLRKALTSAFNKQTRDNNHPPEISGALKAVKRLSRNVSDLSDPAVLRGVLRAIDLRVDGARAAANTARIRRVTLGNAVEYAMERRLLETNPLREVKTKRRKSALREVDPHAVINPMQARMLLEAVGTIGKQGPPLVAFFGLMYYAALRPEEVANIKKTNLSLPEKGWGELHLDGARPEINAEWTDSGTAGEEGPLKHRGENEGRIVPCPPALTELLHEHLARFGTARDGRLFRGARDGGRVGSTVYGRVWATARERVFTAEVTAGPLVKRPYDLRHAAVSTWLNSGVEATRVAKWAGHSLAILLRVYAKCLDGGEQAARERVERGLRGW
jgi:integrase